MSSREASSEENKDDAVLLRRLAGTCARAWPTAGLDAQLESIAASVVRWEALPEIAENEGLAPLVHHHLTRAKIAVPKDVAQALAERADFHRRANLARLSALESVLPAFVAEKIPFLLLNGAALAFTVYPDPALRPMRDIDILVSREDAPRAVKLMFALGWHVPSDSVQKASDLNRRLPLFERVEGDITVAIDLNTRLSIHPPDKRRMSLEHFLPSSQPIAMGNVVGQSPSREDLLWMAFRQGFKTCLTRDGYGMIKAADITTIVESSVETLDWALVSKRQPRLLASLAWMHELTPWSEEIEHRFKHVTRLRELRGIAEDYAGWPRPASSEPSKLLARVRSTLEPPSWWLRLRHGASPRTWGALGAWCRHLFELGRLRLAITFGKKKPKPPLLPPETGGKRSRSFKRFTLKPRGF